MKNWNDQKVVILGAARQGTALAHYLAQHGAQVVLNDNRPDSSLVSARESLADLITEGKVACVFGGHPFSLLDGIDCLFISGGVPLTLPIIEEAQKRGIQLSNDSQIFLETAPCQTIGITGSAGKTTTTTLVGRMAEAAQTNEERRRTKDEGRRTEEGASGDSGSADGASDVRHSSSVIGRSSSVFRRVFVGGNIGNPLISVVDKMTPDDLAILELSSFQLEIMDRSPQVAAILNVTPNHLDRHGTMQAYTAAKARILEFQRATDIAVLGRDDPGAWSQRKKVQGRLLSFGLSELPPVQEGTFLGGDELYLRTFKGEGIGDRGSPNPLSPISSDVRLMSREDIQLRGEHNLLNVLAACAIAAAAGLPVEAMRAGVEGFYGVPHRLEFVRSWSGADWYNDSIATAPERAMAAIRSFEEPLVLLAGGRDKKLPWDEFAELVHSRVDHLIIFGEAAELILQAMDRQTTHKPTNGRSKEPEESLNRRVSITLAKDLREAVQSAAQIVQPGDVVLLSPGGTSFDEFSDFEERGEWFRKLVMDL
jgi:UDP-N-acetylmuramoylalanine--D-glutamate ligase